MEKKVTEKIFSKGDIARCISTHNYPLFITTGKLYEVLDDEISPHGWGEYITIITDKNESIVIGVSKFELAAKFDSLEFKIKKAENKIIDNGLTIDYIKEKADDEIKELSQDTVSNMRLLTQLNKEMREYNEQGNKNVRKSKE